MVRQAASDAAGAAAATMGPDLLADLRASLDAIDADIVDLVARRIGVARELGLAKRSSGMPLFQPEREAAVVRRAAARARELGLDEEALRALFWALIAQCRNAQAEAPS